MGPVRRSGPGVAVALVLLVVGAPGPAGAAAAPCDRFGAGRAVGRVAPAELTEISGIVASRRHPGVLWAHDDSDGAAELVALAADGGGLGTYAVTGARARDWEDVAATEEALYVGDIGDNQGVWPSVTVYRVAEPAAAPTGSGGALVAEPIELRYPDGPVNAEALLVDPVTGDLLVLTKEDGFSRVYVAPASALVTGGPVTLTGAGRFPVPPAASTAFGLPGSLVTAADVSPDGQAVLVRTYRSVLLFTRPEGAPLAAAFARPPCEAAQVEEGQGEAVAFTDGGRAYVTVSEGAHPPLHRFEARPEGTGTPGADARTAGDGTAAVVGVGLAAAVLVLAATVIWRLRRARTTT